jgi:ligand-binding sensor domain-containing protein
VLDKVDPDSRKFVLYRHIPNNANSLAGNVILNVYQDTEGMFWIALLEKGLDKFDLRTNTFTHYPDMPGGTGIYILEDQSGLFWITGAEGIFTFDRRTGEYSEMYPLNCAYGQTIVQDRQNDNILWVGTDKGGLAKFNKTTKQAMNLKPDPNIPDSIGHNTMWHLHMDKAGYLWIPTFGGGLDKFDPRTEAVVKKYQHDPEDPQSIGSDTLNHVYEDSKGRIWVGTVGDGLNALNPDGTFTRYNENTGFPTNWVGSILEDNQGFFWLGT